MAVSLRKGLRSLIRSTGPADNPPEGERSLLAKADGWYDRTSEGVETRLGSGGASELYDGTATGAPDTYLRFVRDQDGDVQQIILGTVD